MNNKIYIVHAVFVTEHERDTIVKAFQNLADAEKYLDDFIASEMESEWYKNTPDIQIFEIGNDYWCAYSECDPFGSFSEIEIKEVEIE